MTAQTLDRTLTCWRIGDPAGAYPIYDATGSTLFPGRWNTTRAPVIYAAMNNATALLEKLAHSSGILPANQHSVRITIPAGLSYEKFSTAHYPGWDSSPAAETCIYGERWVAEMRSAILIVPSVVSRPDENVLINPAHPAAKLIEHSLHEPVYWDRRLFR